MIPRRPLTPAACPSDFTEPRGACPVTALQTDALSPTSSTPTTPTTLPKTLFSPWRWIEKVTIIPNLGPFPWSEAGACATGVAFFAAGSWMRCDIGLAVPLTLETLVLFILANIMVPKTLALTVLMWLTGGALGWPLWPEPSGAMALWSPAGGFMWAMLGAGPLLSWCIRRSKKATLWGYLGATALILACGTLWLIAPCGCTLQEAFWWGLAPQVLPECAKVLLAYGITAALRKARMALRASGCALRFLRACNTGTHSGSLLKDTVCNAFSPGPQSFDASCPPSRPAHVMSSPQPGNTLAWSQNFPSSSNRPIIQMQNLSFGYEQLSLRGQSVTRRIWTWLGKHGWVQATSSQADSSNVPASRLAARTVTDTSPTQCAPQKTLETEDRNPWVLRHIDWTVLPGELVILTGASGSGKTTLLTIAGGLRTGFQGAAEVVGYDLCQPESAALVRPHIGFIFQHHNLMPALSAVDNVALALDIPGTTWTQTAPVDKNRMALDMLTDVGMAPWAQSLPRALSGGQRQRVAIARALVHRPQLILADEPTASLDHANAVKMMQLLHQHVRQRGCACVIITHSQDLMHFADRILTMQEGRFLQATAGTP